MTSEQIIQIIDMLSKTGESSLLYYLLLAEALPAVLVFLGICVIAGVTYKLVLLNGQDGRRLREVCRILGVSMYCSEYEWSQALKRWKN